MDFNKVFLKGRLTKEMELKYLPSGTAVCDFDIAVNEKYGEREDVFFFNVTAFGKVAENTSEYCGKGSPVFLEGRLRQETWETKEGQKRSKVKILAEKVIFLDNKKGDKNG